MDNTDSGSKEHQFDDSPFKIDIDNVIASMKIMQGNLKPSEQQLIDLDSMIRDSSQEGKNLPSKLEKKHGVIKKLKKELDLQQEKEENASNDRDNFEKGNNFSVISIDLFDKLFYFTSISC